MTKIDVQIDEKYREALDLLKQVIPSADGKEITEDSKMIEALIDSFMAFIQEQAGTHE
jgi:predicted ABC-type ATPase